jgi:type I restriction enzyme, R subunit
MKGRGVRVMDAGDLQLVTPDAPAKDRFVIVDAVGVTETDLADTVPLDRKPTVPLEKLLKRVSYGNRDPEVLATIAGRIARLDRRLTAADRAELEKLAGMTLSAITHGIVAALDPDRQLEAAQATAGPEPTEGELAAATRRLLDDAVALLAENPELRQRLVRSYLR